MTKVGWANTAGAFASFPVALQILLWLGLNTTLATAAAVAISVSLFLLFWEYLNDANADNLNTPVRVFMFSLLLSGILCLNLVIDALLLDINVLDRAQWAHMQGRGVMDFILTLGMAVVSCSLIAALSARLAVLRMLR